MLASCKGEVIRECKELDPIELSADLECCPCLFGVLFPSTRDEVTSNSSEDNRLLTGADSASL
jgi:hypothetical protein